MDSSVATKVQAYFDQFPTKHFAKDEIIIWGGYEPEHVYYIVSGKVRQYHIFEDGDRVALNIYRPGAFFSMSWAINRVPNKYFFEALEETVVRPAPIDATLDFLQSNPDIALDLLGRVFRGTDGLLERMANLMADDTSKRLVFELVTECKRARTPGNSMLIALNETELGLQTSLARETVSRQIHKLKAAGLVDVSGDGVVVHDIAGLERLLQ